jgi:hypothetical protein
VSATGRGCGRAGTSGCLPEEDRSVPAASLVPAAAVPTDPRGITPRVAAMTRDDEGKKLDLDLSPGSEHNRDAARKKGLSYDAARKVYRDSDGCPFRDRFGQPLG